MARTSSPSRDTAKQYRERRDTDRPSAKVTPTLVHSRGGYDFAELATKRAHAKVRIAQLEQEIARMDAILLRESVRHGGSFETENGFKITRVSFDRGTISKDLLLEQGVSPIKIQKATNHTPVEFVKVTQKVEKGEKNQGED